ncbi:MAG: AAA family ATPase [Candidatus Riflebacteria bacterium]|nr:AAA family ATPase [Candidatus Riflebacteria bacterium]
MKDKIMELFLHTEGQLFSQQLDNGDYHPINIPAAKIQGAIAKHLSGEITLGVRLIQPGTNLGLAGCIDMDHNSKKGPSIQETLQTAEALQAKFRSHGLEAYIEFSGRRGVHVWLFAAAPLPAKTIRRAIMQVCKECAYDVKEIFPKGDTVAADGTGPGYMPIKLPWGKHRVSGNRSFFLKSGFTPTDAWPTSEAAASEEEFNACVRNDPAAIAGVAALYQEPESKQQQSKITFDKLREDEHPQCINHLITKGAPTDQVYNNVNLTLARYCQTRKFKEQAAIQLATAMANNTSAEHSSSKKSLTERVNNFKSALRSAQANPDAYQWSCGYILASRELLDQDGCARWDCPHSTAHNEDAPIKSSPASEAVESDVIDFMLSDPKVGLEKALSINPPSDGFLNPVNREIWRQIDEIGKAGGELRSSTLLSALEGLSISSELKEKVSQRIAKPISNLCSVATYTEHLIKIRDVGLKVLLHRHVNSARTELSGNDVPLQTTLDTLMVKAGRFLLQATTEFKPMADGLGDLIHDLIFSKATTIHTFAPRLNTLLNGGLGMGKLGVIASPPGGGKTTFVSQIADNAAKSGVPALYASYEMGKQQLLTYSLARSGGINSGHIETRIWERMDARPAQELQDKLGAAITDYTTNIAPKTTIVEASSDTTTSVLRGLVTRVRREAGLHDDSPVLVIVDYLQPMPCGEEEIDQGTRDTIRVSRVATQLKQLARDTGSAVLAISDINKAAYEEATKTGNLNMGALRDSFKIAHAADQVYLLQTNPIEVKVGKESAVKDQLELYKDNFRTDTRMQRKIQDAGRLHPIDKSISATYARLSLLKNRGGRTGVALFLYEKAYHRFVPLDLGEVLEIQEETDNGAF